LNASPLEYLVLSLSRLVSFSQQQNMFRA
jgi:hypothetical protein